MEHVLPPADAGLVATQMQGIVWGLLSLPICLWVFYTDLSRMVIRNYAVLAMLAIFAITGPFLLPLAEYGLRYVHFAVVLVVGFVLNKVIGFGAGDAKFAAAIAPFVARGDLPDLGILYIVWGIALVVGMFVARRIKPLRAAAPDWKSWDNVLLPFGCTLAATHLSYLALAALSPSPAG